MSNELWQRRHRKKLLRRNPHCAYCNRYLTSTTATLDHEVPRALGGSEMRHNLVLACQPCNQAKADMPPEKFRASINKGKA
jgi:5-methylcytosine-specific restriction endonuclease McrA